MQIEDAKKSLILYGNKVSQVMKDVLTDLHKIKRVSQERGLTQAPYVTTAGSFHEPGSY